MRTFLETFQDTSQTVDEVMKIPWRTFLTIQILLTPINSTPKTGYDDGKKDMIHMDLGKVQQTSAEVTPNCGEKYGKSPPNARNHSSCFFRIFCRKSAPDVWWFVAFNDFSLFPPSCWNREIIQSLSSTGRTSTGYLTNETMDWPFRLENLRALRGKEVSYWWWDTLTEQFDIIVTCFCWYLIMIMIMVMM